jgi:hypothetical protein
LTSDIAGPGGLGLDGLGLTATAHPR